MTIEELSNNVDIQFSAVNLRLSEMYQLLLQLQSDLRMFYRELGYQDARLDNLEGKQ